MSKIESKNYQILQQSQAPDCNTSQKCKSDKKIKQSPVAGVNPYSENIIFSEDDVDSKKMLTLNDQFTMCSESETENLELIRQYVWDFTNDLITKVCERVESSTSPFRNAASNINECAESGGLLNDGLY